MVVNIQVDIQIDLEPGEDISGLDDDSLLDDISNEAAGQVRDALAGAVSERGYDDKDFEFEDYGDRFGGTRYAKPDEFMEPKRHRWRPTWRKGFKSR